MSTFPTEYYIILAFILLVPILIVVMVVMNNYRKTKMHTELKVNIGASCPNCSTDLIQQINERQNVTKGDMVRVVCPSCNQGSAWNTSGFPPTLLGGEAKSADGISKNLKEKYNR